jgi:hypothetical protein
MGGIGTQIHDYLMDLGGVGEHLARVILKGGDDPDR